MSLEFYERDEKERPADVADIHFLSLKEGSRFSSLNKEFQEQNFCPPSLERIIPGGKESILSKARNLKSFE